MNTNKENGNPKTLESFVFRKNNLIWEIPSLIIIVVSYLLWSEQLNISANFWLILLYCSIISFCAAVILHKTIFKGKEEKKLKILELGVFIGIIGILVSGISDVLTQSDTQKWEIVKRIYVKNNSIDLSEIQKPEQPQIVIAIDMSESMQKNRINQYREGRVRTFEDIST